MSEYQLNQPVLPETGPHSPNKPTFGLRVLGATCVALAMFVVPPSSESVLQQNFVTSDIAPESIDPSLIIHTMPEQTAESSEPASGTAVSSAESSQAVQSTANVPESTAVTSSSTVVTPKTTAPTTIVAKTTTTPKTTANTVPKQEQAPTPPMEEITGTPTNVALYHVDKTGIHKYIDSPVAVNPSATIVLGQGKNGPIFNFEPGCGAVDNANTPKASCGYVKDYDEVDVMTQRGYPSSVKKENDPRLKTGTWFAGHSTNYPNDPLYKPLSFQLLVNAKPGDIAVVTATEKNVTQTYIYQVQLTDEILKHSVLSDPRVNGPNALAQNRLTLFTCVASNGVTPLDQQQNALVQSVMVGAQTAPFNIQDWVTKYYAVGLKG